MFAKTTTVATMPRHTCFLYLVVSFERFCVVVWKEQGAGGERHLLLALGRESLMFEVPSDGDVRCASTRLGLTNWSRIVIASMTAFYSDRVQDATISLHVSVAKQAKDEAIGDHS
jgi:hypothetical protein